MQMVFSGAVCHCKHQLFVRKRERKASCRKSVAWNIKARTEKKWQKWVTGFFFSLSPPHPHRIIWPVCALCIPSRNRKHENHFYQVDPLLKLNKLHAPNKWWANESVVAKKSNRINIFCRFSPTRNVSRITCVCAGTMSGCTVYLYG